MEEAERDQQQKALKEVRELRPIKKINKSTPENNLIALICSHFRTQAPHTVFVFNFLVHQVEK